MKLSPPAARIGLALAALAALTGVALAGGSSMPPASVRLASSDDGPGATSPTTGVDTTAATTDTSAPGPDRTTPGSTPPGASTATVDAAGAGAVVYARAGNVLVVVRAAPAAGWTVDVEQGSGREIEVDFRSGTRRVQVNVEIEDGAVRERVRARDDATGTDVRTEGGASAPPTSTPAPTTSTTGPTTSTTIDDSDDDDDDDEDRSGRRGGDDSDEDRSGPSDDDDRDDD